MMRISAGVIIALIMAAAIEADDTAFVVIDNDGGVIENAVVMLTPSSGQELNAVNTDPPLMIQENTLFDPFVLVTQVNTAIIFPNRDRFRHHIYSFSKGNRFELQVYGREEEVSYTPTASGAIAIGCNIHDNMLAFIYVADAPRYGTTNQAGAVTFFDLPAGTYTLEVWHPDIVGRKAQASEISLPLIDQSPVTIDIKLKARRSVQTNINSGESD